MQSCGASGARFDSLELMWDYDSIAALKRVDVQMFWVLAADGTRTPTRITEGYLRLIADWMKQEPRGHVWACRKVRGQVTERIAHMHRFERAESMHVSWLYLYCSTIPRPTRSCHLAA
jgi:hypothetical protein